ncbi:hypothetical protein [Microvirga terrae]|uniref:hypothetical protein n=1 Tax=Microvirga terrae TaxID=2740529 RepID=UPI003D81C259
MSQHRDSFSRLRGRLFSTVKGEIDLRFDVGEPGRSALPSGTLVTERREAQKLLSLAGAVDALMRVIRPVPSCEVNLRDAEGFVLAEPVIAATDVPRARTALRDGYAVRACDTVGASSFNPVYLNKPPVMVAAGDTLPVGCNAVLPVDALSLENGVVEICQCIAPSESTRLPGGDAAQAAVLRNGGERVRSIDIACGLAAGVETCAVRQLRTRLLVAPESNETLCTLVATLLRRAGSLVSAPSGFGGRADLAAALGEPGADLIVVIGGSGFWRSDVRSSSVAGVGALIAYGLAVRPGEAGGCGIVNEIPVLLIPSQMEAALALMLTVAQPCLSMYLAAAAERPLHRGRVTRKIVSAVGMSDVALLRNVNGELEPLAVADLSLSAIAAADAWIMIPPSSEGIAVGTVVEAQALW